MGSMLQTEIDTAVIRRKQQLHQSPAMELPPEFFMVLVEPSQQAMRPVDFVEIGDFKIGERSLRDAVGLEDRSADCYVTVTAEAGLDVPDWRHGHVLPIKRPVPVRQVALIIALLSQRALVGVDEVAMPGEERSCVVRVFAKMHVDPGEIIVESLVQLQLRRQSPQALDGLNVISFFGSA